VVIPIAIGVATSQIQKSISDQSVAKDYVGIAITILERPKGEQETNLSQWAVELLNQYSPIKFSTPQQEELKSGGLIGLNLSSLLSGREALSAISSSPDRKTAALIKTILDRPGGRSILEVYDSHTVKRISYLQVGDGWGIWRLVWSDDGLKLLVSRSYSGKADVNLVDVAHGTSLGSYQTKGPGGEIETLSFSQDGRVTINRSDGKSEIWQPGATP
jgi:hypothetical protein